MLYRYRKFFKKVWKWVDDEKTHQHKVAKICEFNRVMIEELDTVHVGNWNKNEFMEYLNGEAAMNYNNVSLREMRFKARDPEYKYDIGKEHKFRIPYIWTAFWYELCLDATGEYKTKWNNNGEIKNLVGMITSFFLACYGMPVYALSRLFHLFAPIFVLLYLYIDGNIFIFTDLPPFQVIIWIIDTILIIIWCVLVYYDVMEDYYSWHMLPNIKRWAGFGDNESDYKRYIEVFDKMENRYFKIMLWPLCNKVLRNEFGLDVTNIIFEYVEAINSINIKIEKMLIEKFNTFNNDNDLIACIILDYLGEDP